MFCPNCGAKVNDDAAFCGNCGNRLESISEKEKEELKESVENSDDREKETTKKAKKEPEKKKSSSAVKVVGILVGVFVGSALIFGGIAKVAQQTPKKAKTQQSSTQEKSTAEKAETEEVKTKVMSDENGEMEEIIVIEPKIEKTESEEAKAEETASEEEVVDIVKVEATPTATPEPTATPIPTPVPEPKVVTDPTEAQNMMNVGQRMITAGEIVHTDCSSQYYQTKKSTDPRNLFDNNMVTNWQEGVSGLGAGEWVVALFNQEYEVTQILLRLGNWNPEPGKNYFWTNNRPKTLNFELGGMSWPLTFPDGQTMFGVKFTSPVKTSELKITILDAYSGSLYNDTVISDVMVYVQ